jgi:hypothetical protein
MSQVNASACIYMLNIKRICWGMLGVITVGALEPVVLAATVETTQPAESNGKILLAADPSLANILSGNSIPTTVRLKDLTPDWRAMSTNGQFEFGNFQTVFNSFGGGLLATSYYTKGQTVTVGSETYVVAYSLLSLADKVSPDVPLNLSLLNLRTIGTMSNIRSFDVAKETKILEKQLSTLQLSNVFDPTKIMDSDKDKDKVVPEEPTVTPPVKKPTVRKKRRSTKRKYIRRSRSTSRSYR